MRQGATILHRARHTWQAIYWGSCANRLSHVGAGEGPWLMADLENGLWAGNLTGVNPRNAPVDAEFVTAMLKGRPGGFALKGGDAQARCSLELLTHPQCTPPGRWPPHASSPEVPTKVPAPLAGARRAQDALRRPAPARSAPTARVRPDAQAGARSRTPAEPDAAVRNISTRQPPQRHTFFLWQGAIVLGIGGDNSHGAVGTFYEGVITRGFASDATDAAVHDNIQAAGYGR